MAHSFLVPFSLFIGMAFVLSGCGSDTSDASPGEGCFLDQTPCEWSGGKAEVRQKEGDEQVLVVELGRNQTDRLIAVWRGRDMFMGEYPVAMERRGGDSSVWEASFTLPFCSVHEEMIWELGFKTVGGVNPVPVPLWYRSNVSQ